MAITVERLILKWPKPEDIDPREVSFAYDTLIDLLELSFTTPPLPAIETPLETDTKFRPKASLRYDDEIGELAGEVVGVMIDNLSEAFPEHPDWRILTEGKIDRNVLASLIETLSVLPEYADEGVSPDQ